MHPTPLVPHTNCKGTSFYYPRYEWFGREHISIALECWRCLDHQNKGITFLTSSCPPLVCTASLHTGILMQVACPWWNWSFPGEQGEERSKAKIGAYGRHVDCGGARHGVCFVEPSIFCVFHGYALVVVPRVWTRAAWLRRWFCRCMPERVVFLRKHVGAYLT